MPYIITTERRPELAQDVPCHDPVRPARAAATFDEARGIAEVELWHNGAEPEIFELDEQGGEIGPLNDGTVIEVRRVTWDEICESDKSIADYAIDSWNASHEGDD